MRLYLFFFLVLFGSIACSSEARLIAKQTSLEPFFKEIKQQTYASYPRLEPDPRLWPWDFSVGLENLDRSLVAPGQALQIDVQTESQKSPNGNCLLTVRYPVVKGLRDQQVQENLNRSLRQNITVEKEEDFQRELSAEFCQIQHQDEHKKNWRWNTEMSACQIKYAQGTVTSVFCSGGRYGSSVYPVKASDGVTFNLKTGQVYDLSDFFSPHANYHQTIKHHAANQAIQWNGNLSLTDATSRLEMDQQVFYLADNCENRISVSSVPKITLDAAPTCFVFPSPFFSGVERAFEFYLTIDRVQDIFTQDETLNMLLDPSVSDVGQ